MTRSNRGTARRTKRTAIPSFAGTISLGTAGSCAGIRVQAATARFADCVSTAHRAWGSAETSIASDAAVGTTTSWAALAVIGTAATAVRALYLRSEEQCKSRIRSGSMSLHNRCHFYNMSKHCRVPERWPDRCAVDEQAGVSEKILTRRL